MLYSRITNFDQAEQALVDATGMKFPCEENWKLHAIAEEFKYKLPVELTRVFFRGRTDYQVGQTGFDSIYGSAFTLVLKLLQAYTLELALSTLDEATQRKFVDRFQTREFLTTLCKFKTEEQLAEVLDDILIAANGKDLVLVKAPVKESTEYGIDVNGKLAFLKWLINSLNEQIPDANTMQTVKDYVRRLCSLTDSPLIDLLNSLYSLYNKPQGYFSATSSAQSHIDQYINQVKMFFPIMLLNLDIPKLFPDLLTKANTSFEAGYTEPSQLTAQENFISLVRSFGPIVEKCRLTEQFFEYNGEQLNIGSTYYNVLEGLAYFAIGRKKPSEDEAFVSLGLDKNTTTFDFFILKWNLEQQQFTAWLDGRKNVSRNYLSEEQNSRNDEVIQVYLQKFMAFRVLFDELSDKHVGLPAEVTPGPKTSTLANLSSEDDFFMPEKADLSATRALHIKKAKAYIEQRWLSSWLIQSGYGGIVKFFSPLRYHKILVTLEYLNNLESKNNDSLSTGHILGLLKSENLDNLSENWHKVKLNIKEAVKREKMEGIESTARTETEYEAKHAQIPLPFFWRFADISREYYKVNEKVERKTEDALNHDGIWSQCMD